MSLSSSIAQGGGNTGGKGAGGGAGDPGDSGLTKVVLARRSDVLLRGQLDPLALLETLQDRDPRAYQVNLRR